MDSYILFYENNDRGKKNWLFCTIFLIICFVGWTLSFILSLVIPIPEGILPESVNNRPELGDIIGIIVLLALILTIIIYLFII